MKKNQFLALVFFAFLLAPFLVLILKFPLQFSFDYQEFVWAFKNTIYQSALSALISLFLGTWLALGIIRLPLRWQKKADILSLIPNFFPPLFSLLVIFYWVAPFPTGIIGIALVHSMINFGLVGVSLRNSIQVKLGGLAEVALIQGCSRWRFFRKVYVPMMMKEYLTLFVFVFSICFSSFSVPLIVGGGRGTTLEVLIYEKIRLSMDWGGAVLLSIFQLSMMGLLSIVVLKKPSAISSDIRQPGWIGHPSGVIFLLGFIGFYFGGYLMGVIEGLSQLSSFYEIKAVLVESFIGTLFVGLSAGFVVLGLLMMSAYLYRISFLRTFLRSYIAPSTTLTGFAFLVFGPNEGVFSYLKIPIAMGLLFLGPLYRMGWDDEVMGLQGQVMTAQSLGADEDLIFKKIIYPQILQKGLFLSGLASVWACGDFALTRILAYKDMTLGLMTETLLSTYRLGMASVVSLGILFCGLVCFFTFWGLRYVYHRKFI